MKTARLDELEKRLRTALASALRSATANEPSWRRFEPSLKRGGAKDDAPQNGTSSSMSAKPADAEGTDR